MKGWIVKKRLWLAVVTASFFFVSGGTAVAQLKWTVGGNLGLSIIGGAAGLQFGPMAEASFNKNMAVGSELSINTQAGTPIEWGNYFKYFFVIPGSKIRPYADGGLSLFFFTGGPYFGIRFGGGATFPLANKLLIAPEIQLGPVFGGGGSTFYLVLRGGIRYEL